MARLMLLLALLAVPSYAIVSSQDHIVQKHAEQMEVEAESEELATIPVHLFKKDCWKKRPVSTSMLQQSELPGAGLAPVVSFQTVLKDGFYQVDCVKDTMLQVGDKFGKNKFKYNQADVSDVSVVRYTEVVPREDQKSMSPAVCFAFCRTIPDMLFFGISNGRDCYCAPYYKAMVDDNSMCDSVCEGSPSMMCGGKTKSNMWEMHSCSTTGRDLIAAVAKIGEVDADMSNTSADVRSVANDMQAAAVALQTSFGNAGDPAAAHLMQKAKEFAGKLKQDVKVANGLSANKTTPLTGSATAMQGSDFTSFSNAKRAEDLIDAIEEAVTAEEAALQHLEADKRKASPRAVNGSAGQYYSVMYFVDKKFASMPSTCDGQTIKAPFVGHPDTCATVCNSLVHDCVGYQFFQSDQVDAGGLCFLFSKLKSVRYYTGCPAAFLQKKDNMETATAQKTRCVAKFSQFEGTTLKPDPSGKCNQCLKKAQKADRCFS